MNTNISSSKLWFYSEILIISLTDLILAFHNWITFYFYEKSGKIDYEGFMPNKKGKNEKNKKEKVSLLHFLYL